VKVLVTGGAGFVGSHLVDGLLAAGHEVRVLDSLEPQVHGPGRERPAYLSSEAELIVGDVRDRDAVARALEGVEVVYHEAAAVGVGQSMYEIERYVSVNSLGGAVLLEELVARRDRIRRVVVASSNTLYGEGAYRDVEGGVVHPSLRTDEQLAERRFELSDASGRPLKPIATPESKPLQPTSIYAITKRDHEEMFLAVGSAYGIPTVVLRYFCIFGTRQALSNPYTGVVAIFSSRLLHRRPPPVFEDGLQTRDFVHVSDIVRANLLALSSERAVGGVYNVGTSRATSILEVADLLSRAIGVEVSPDLVGKYRAGDIRHCFADVALAERDLGFRPEMSLEAALPDFLEWLGGQTAEDCSDAAVQELAARGLTR
jgi:dTDP-L-rhamnose 4-epimerase